MSKNAITKLYVLNNSNLPDDDSVQDLLMVGKAYVRMITHCSKQIAETNVYIIDGKPVWGEHVTFPYEKDQDHLELEKEYQWVTEPYKVSDLHETSHRWHVDCYKQRRLNYFDNFDLGIIAGLGYSFEIIRGIYDENKNEQAGIIFKDNSCE